MQRRRATELGWSPHRQTGGRVRLDGPNLKSGRPSVGSGDRPQLRGDESAQRARHSSSPAQGAGETPTTTKCRPNGPTIPVIKQPGRIPARREPVGPEKIFSRSLPRAFDPGWENCWPYWAGQDLLWQSRRQGGGTSRRRIAKRRSLPVRPSEAMKVLY
jgi:hypothetical protein